MVAVDARPRRRLHRLGHVPAALHRAEEHLRRLQLGVRLLRPRQQGGCRNQAARVHLPFHAAIFGHHLFGPGDRRFLQSGQEHDLLGQRLDRLPGAERLRRADHGLGNGFPVFPNSGNGHQAMLDSSPMFPRHRLSLGAAAGAGHQGRAIQHVVDQRNGGLAAAVGRQAAGVAGPEPRATAAPGPAGNPGSIGRTPRTAR